MTSQDDWLEKEWELRRRNQEIDARGQLANSPGKEEEQQDQVEGILNGNGEGPGSASSGARKESNDNILARSWHQYKLQNEKLAKEVEQLKRDKSNLASDLKVAQLQLRRNPAEAAAGDDRGRKEGLERELQGLRKELEEARGRAGAAERRAQADAVRANRRAEEAARLRAREREHEGEVRDLRRALEEAKSEARSEAAAREKQARQMAAAFRKQQELVQVLRQQKLHLEASRVLDFTEEEFINSLDWKPLLDKQWKKQ